jgi:hypothetical protein
MGYSAGCSTVQTNLTQLTSKMLKLVSGATTILYHLEAPEP